MVLGSRGVTAVLLLPVGSVAQCCTCIFMPRLISGVGVLCAGARMAPAVIPNMYRGVLRVFIIRFHLLVCFAGSAAKEAQEKEWRKQGTPTASRASCENLLCCARFPGHYV